MSKNSFFTNPQNEQVLRTERIHPGIYSISILLTLPLLFFVGLMQAMISLFSAAVGKPILPLISIFLWMIPMLIGSVSTLLIWLSSKNSEIVLTKRELTFKGGFLIRTSGEIPLENVEGTFVLEPLLGRLFGYGTVTVTTVGGAQFPLLFIRKSSEFQSMLKQAVADVKKPASKPNDSPEDDSRYMPKR